MLTEKTPQQRLRLEEIFIAAVAIMLTIPFLGTHPFATRGEPREALVAQAMLQSGNWLLGSGYGGAIPSKPPFMHWFIALFSFLAGGINEWTARLPSALASIAFAVVWFRELRRRTEFETAALATLVLLTSIEWYRAATGCRVDMVFSVLIVLGFCGLFRWWERGLAGYPIWTVAALFGATLSKGPVAIGLPGVIFAIFLYVQGERLPRILTKCCAVFLPALLGAAVWYLCAYIERGSEFFNKFYYENIARLSSTQEDAPHKHWPPYLYATVLLGFLPWTIIALQLLPRFLKWLRGGIAKWKAWFLALPPFERFAVIIAVGFVLFFSIPQGKRSVYLLPIYPFLAYGLARKLVALRYNTTLATRASVRLLAGVGAIAALFIFVFSKIVGSEMTVASRGVVGMQNFLSAFWQDSMQVWLATIFLGVCLFVVFCTAQSLKRPLTFALILAALFPLVTGSFFTYFETQLSARDFAAQIASKLDAKTPLYSFGNEFYGLSFYLGREIKTSGAIPAPPAYAFACEEDAKTLQGKVGPDERLMPIARSTHFVDKTGCVLSVYRVEEGNGEIFKG